MAMRHWDRDNHPRVRRGNFWTTTAYGKEISEMNEDEFFDKVHLGGPPLSEDSGEILIVELNGEETDAFVGEENQPLEPGWYYLIAAGDEPTAEKDFQSFGPHWSKEAAAAAAEHLKEVMSEGLFGSELAQSIAALEAFSKPV
jgi:hypothetical protein